MAEGNSGEWNVSEESVERLKQLAQLLKELAEELAGTVSTLKDDFEENEKGLGTHSEDIIALIEDMEKPADESTAVVNKLSFKLLKAAAVRQSHIDNSVYSGKGRGGLGAGAFAAGVAGAAGAVAGGAVAGAASSAGSGAENPGTGQAGAAAGQRAGNSGMGQAGAAAGQRAGNPGMGQAEGSDGNSGGSSSTGGNGGMPSSAGNEPYQYCLGVLTKGNVSSDYMEVIGIRRDNAEPYARRIFDHFADKLVIQNADYPKDETAHYSPMSSPGHLRGVYYNAEADMYNPRGAGTTYFHELGHMIDHASTGYQENMSNNIEFGRALVEDGQNVLSIFNSMTPEKRSNFLNVIRQDSAHSFSDLIDAITNGQLHGSYGHSREYWQRNGNLQAEAFAHFFEASMGGGWKLELLSNMFPTAFAVFSEMLESIQPEGKYKVLKRQA